MTTIRVSKDDAPNGAAVAAILAAGIGAFAMGFIVILDAAGLFVAPTLFGPAGGVTGRTTLAIVVWLASWGLLHHRWKDREVAHTGAFALTFVLIGLGLLLTFPPVWSMF